jgi:cyclopropane fatty-acyl-phospholipid synthase-like methyltransferase
MFRYATQQTAQRLIVRDVIEKLSVGPDDDLLEIGCGPFGTTLVPLAFMCASVTGLDHEEVIAALRGRHIGPPELHTVCGNFLDVELHESFSKVLVYSMLHYLASLDEAIDVSLKAGRLLRPGGRMLLGDLPNTDKKRRFLATDAGRRFDEEWRSSARSAGHSQPAASLDDDHELLGAFDDDGILMLVSSLRGEGFEAYVVPQPRDLPFGHTREDVLVLRLD